MNTAQKQNVGTEKSAGLSVAQFNTRLTPGRIAVAAALIALPLLYFYPALASNLALAPGDGLSQNFGVRVLIGRMLAAGYLPLWNPYIFAGTPLLASIYPGALYPPNWLFAVLAPITAMNWVVITTYHLALIGAYLYARRIGMTRVGALLGALTFTFGGFMVAHLGHTSRIAAAVWLPWILLALEQLYQRAAWRWIALGALFIALQLFAGEPQMSFYTILVCGAYGLFALLARAEVESRLRFFLSALLMSVCGMLLSAIQLFPERELLQQGERAQIPYETFAGFSFPPGNIFTFLMPFFYGGGASWPYTIPYWNAETIDETCGYFGLAALLLGIVALLGYRAKSLVWFWAGVAVVSFVLALGGNLPFGLNHVLHHTPVYNLFRASARHLYEFTFSWGMLAGFGASYLAQKEQGDWQRTLRRSAVVFLGLLAVAVFCYRFLSGYLVTGNTMPAGANLMVNAELLAPVGFALLSLAAVWGYARWRNALWSCLLIAVLFLDLLSWSLAFNWNWRDFVSRLDEKMQDPPAVQFIKAREKDLNSFRIVTAPLEAGADNYHQLNLPNVSITRGLQSVNGYDALRLSRLGEIAGEMGSDGLLTERRIFYGAHQGFDLLSVKYLLREKKTTHDEQSLIERAGIRFNKEPLSLFLSAGAQVQFAKAGQATELALITALGNSDHLPNGQPILRLKLYTTDGRVLEREVQAGRDTAEWAYDRPDVRARIKHDRATVSDTWSAGGFEGHHYLARLPFERAEIARIEIAHVPDSADLTIYWASLFDAKTGASTPLDEIVPTPARWRKLNEFGPVEVYENLRQLPRAWFVRRAAVLPRQDVLQAIKTGQLAPGAAFNAAETVLLEKEDFGNRPVVLPPIGDPAGAEANVTRYEPNHIELQTRNPQPGFLVLSEVFYRGWEAWVDGKRLPVERVNYALRGLALPPGAHRVEFVFRAHSFRNGAAYSALGVFLLLLGAVISRTSGGAQFRRRLFDNGTVRQLEADFSEALARPAPIVLRYVKQSELLTQRLPRHTELLLIALLGLCALWFIYTQCPIGPPIRSDGVGYYIYLPSLFFKHTSALDVVAREQFGEQFTEWVGLRLFPETGRYVNQYGLGEATLLSPFFLLGHCLAWLTGAKRDGFSWPYHAAAALSGLFYVIAGLYLLKRSLAARFSPRTVVLTLLVITFATNLFHYATFDNIFSHGYSFFLFSALLYLTPRWHARPNWSHTLLVAVVAGLITLVRPTNTLFLIFVPLLGLNSRAALEERGRFLWRNPSKVLGGIGAYCLTIFPMLLYWKLSTHHWLVNPYVGIPFHWTEPQILKVLFSVRKGLFFWSPVLLLAVAGLGLVERYWKGFVLPAVLFLLAQLYLVASWDNWAFGGAFGHRAFTEALVIFAVGYASLIEFSGAYKRAARVVTVLSVLCALLSVKLMLHYWLGSLPYDDVTLPQFLAALFKLAG